MRPTDPARAPSAAAAGRPERPGRPHWHAVRRALREARGLTQDGWAGLSGVGRTSVQRWARGEGVPDPHAEAAILAACRERELLHAHDEGSLAGLALTAEWLAEGRGQELAAARAPALEVEEIAAMLHDRFRLATGGSRTALPRQRTLRATLDWSHNLLGEAERALLRQVAVCAADWTLAAAEALCGDQGQQRSVLGAEPLVAAWAAGRALSWEQAAAEAPEQTRPS